MAPSPSRRQLRPRDLPFGESSWANKAQHHTRQFPASCPGIMAWNPKSRCHRLWRHRDMETSREGLSPASHVLRPSRGNNQSRECTWLPSCLRQMNDGRIRSTGGPRVGVSGRSPLVVPILESAPLVFSAPPIPARIFFTIHRSRPPSNPTMYQANNHENRRRVLRKAETKMTQPLTMWMWPTPSP